MNPLWAAHPLGCAGGRALSQVSLVMLLGPDGGEREDGTPVLVLSSLVQRWHHETRSDTGQAMPLYLGWQKVTTVALLHLRN